VKYAAHFLVTFLLGFPALIAGYLWAAITGGWSTGKFMHDRHERAAIAKWLP
jgi:hypothetical protein